MSYTIETKDNKATLTVTVPKEEVLDAMKATAKTMSEETKIPGFRPGKADYETVKRRVGEMQILEAALEGLIRDNFLKAMIKEDLETVGQPHFHVEKMAPGNDVVFTAEIALFPKLTQLADYEKLSVEKKDTTPTAEMVERAKKDLALMQTKETRADKGHKITKGDKAVVALGMKKDGVVLEGGESQSHGIYTAEEHYIPGFVDQIIGLSEGEKKSFVLPFPEEHYQKHLAGKDIHFDVEVKEIHKLEAPVLDDAYAKKLGVKDAADLEKKLQENLRAENEYEEGVRQDRAVLDLIAEKSRFETIPDLLVNQEIEKMIHELRHQVTEQGMDFDQYLKNIKKSLADLKLDFTKNALQRVKIAILLKEIAKKEKIEIPDADLDQNLDRTAAQYEDAETKKRVYEPEYREFMRAQMTNRKTIDFLKSKIVK